MVQRNRNTYKSVRGTSVNGNGCALADSIFFKLLLKFMVHRFVICFNIT